MESNSISARVFARFCGVGHPPSWSSAGHLFNGVPEGHPRPARSETAWCGDHAALPEAALVKSRRRSLAAKWSIQWVNNE